MENRNDRRRNLDIWKDRHFSGRKFSDIAKEYGISAGRVRQICKSIDWKIQYVDNQEDIEHAAMFAKQITDEYQDRVRRLIRQAQKKLANEIKAMTDEMGKTLEAEFRKRFEYVRDQQKEDE